uniref:NAC039 n=1 Tax=Arundo donax TaxID=35708 RepID=A0A0A8YB77_ARUDO
MLLKIPWLDAVEIDVAYDIEVDLLGGHLLPEVVADELLVGGVEPEARGHA